MKTVRFGEGHWSLLACLASLTIVVAIAGCGGEGNVELAPVTGTITQNGQPLANADVVFSPAGDVEASTSAGTTDENGKFELQYNDGRNGAVPGKHQVTITVGGPSSEEPAEGGGEEEMSVAVPMAEPVEYYKEAEVSSSGENDFTFEVAE